MEWEIGKTLVRQEDKPSGGRINGVRRFLNTLHNVGVSDGGYSKTVYDTEGNPIKVFIDSRGRIIPEQKSGGNGQNGNGHNSGQ